MPQIDAFISDLDDTLLTREHEMTERTENTLKRLLQQGVKVILASGRSAASMRPTVLRIGTPYPYIAYNGAQIVAADTGAAIDRDEVPLALAQEVLRWFEAQGVYAQYYDGDDWFYARRCDFSDEYAHSTGVVGTQTLKPLSETIARDTPKVLAVDTAERAQALIAQGREVFGDRLSITTSKPYFVEITSPTATKGNAVARLAGRIGLSPDTTICAGDSLNDLSMLQWSRLPVSVSNARDEVKRIAWRIAGDGHRDGIADLLDELIPAAQRPAGE